MNRLEIRQRFLLSQDPPKRRDALFESITIDRILEGANNNVTESQKLQSRHEVKLLGSADRTRRTRQKEDIKEKIYADRRRKEQEKQIKRHLAAKAEADKIDAVRDRLRQAFYGHEGGYDSLPENLRDTAKALPQPDNKGSYEARFEEATGEKLIDGAAGLLNFQTPAHVKARKELDGQIEREMLAARAEHVARDVRVNDLRYKFPNSSFAELVYMADPRVKKVKKIVEAHYRNARSGDTTTVSNFVEVPDSERVEEIRRGVDIIESTAIKRMTPVLDVVKRAALADSIRERLVARANASVQAEKSLRLGRFVREVNKKYPPVPVEVFKQDDAIPSERTVEGILLADRITRRRKKKAKRR